jgi:hypothetical protein
VEVQQMVNPNNNEPTSKIIRRVEDNVKDLNNMLKMFIFLYDETVKYNLDKVSAIKTKIKEKVDRVL